MDPRDLYGLPLDRFTQERNALAKRLRREQRRDEAAEVSKLRKPSVAAWVVNQLVRTQRREIDALFDAGDTLQKAQADLLAGQANPGALRKAVEAERAAVGQLTEKARGLLSSEGHELTAARLEQASQTLHAAALDEAARAQVRAGFLHRELRHVGLGAATRTPRAGTAAGKTRASSPTATSSRPGRDRAAEARAGRVKAARRAETDARRQTERAAGDVDAAEKQRDRAAEALHEAEENLARAREVADETALEHRRSQAALDDL